MRARLAVVEVAPRVHLCRGREVNWIVLRDGDEATLVDSGYPGDTPAVLASLDRVGVRPEAVRAVLLTHAHVDHMGAATLLHDRFGTPVLTDAVEVAHARRERLEQAGPADVVRNLWRRGALGWATRISRAGASRDIALPFASPFGTGPNAALDLPGAPVPVPTHGHTSGHTAFLLPGSGVVLTGDELVTGHSLSRTVGPQRLPAFFAHAPGGPPALEAALDALAGLDADVVVPGHGDVWRQPIAAAVERARAT